MFHQNGLGSIKRILAMASHMVDTKHYAATHIRLLGGKINRAWNQLTAALDARNTLLLLSVAFHQKAEKVIKQQHLFAKQRRFSLITEEGCLRHNFFSPLFHPV